MTFKKLASSIRRSKPRLIPTTQEVYYYNTVPGVVTSVDRFEGQGITVLITYEGTNRSIVINNLNTVNVRDGQVLVDGTLIGTISSTLKCN